MRGQEFREKDDDEQKDRDEKSVHKVISRDRKWKTTTMMMMRRRKILNHSHRKWKTMIMRRKKRI